MKQIVVVNNPKHWTLNFPGAEIVSAKEYLMNSLYATRKRIRIYNLCKSYRYQSEGYYVSLLALARGHRPFPNVLAIQDIKSQTMIRLISDDLNTVMQKSLKPIQSGNFTLSVYFGKNLARRHNQLAQKLFSHFQAPLLRAEFIRQESEWLLRQIQTISYSDVPQEHRPFLEETASDFFSRPPTSFKKKEFRYDMAILTNPDEEMPPSDARAIQKMIKAAASEGIYTELITREDAGRINEFDALFIRETTSVNHHTYRISRRAEAEGLIVIDDPKSILLCTNKVYLAELLQANNIPCPKTIIFSQREPGKVTDALSYPFILKQPDSSFSQGVVKADSAQEFATFSRELFQTSDLLIAQEFIPTDFDWRIGILDGEILFGCRYFMAKKHWQIYKHRGNGRYSEGGADSVAVGEIPKIIRDTALQAAALIGDGLYGVDIKEHKGQACVIEINDNPNIDHGIEDEILKDELYEKIIRVFISRIEKKKGV